MFGYKEETTVNAQVDQLCNRNFFEPVLAISQTKKKKKGPPTPAGVRIAIEKRRQRHDKGRRPRFFWRETTERLKDHEDCQCTNRSVLEKRPQTVLGGARRKEEWWVGNTESNSRAADVFPGTGNFDAIGAFEDRARLREIRGRMNACADN